MRMNLLAAAAVCVLLLGCSTTKITDDMVGPTVTETTTTVPDGTVIVTRQQVAGTAVRESYSGGLLWQPQSAEHKRVTLGLDKLDAEGAGGDWVSLGGGFGGLFIFGALVCVAGVVLWVWLKLPSLGIGLLMLGGGLIFTGFLMETFPIPLLIILILAVAAAVFFAWKGGAFKVVADKFKKATVQIVDSVEELKKDKTAEEKKAINTVLKSKQDKDVQSLAKAAGATSA